jgi:predicted  nucleic acid-binding Zn-ribbon protein
LSGLSPNQLSAASEAAPKIKSFYQRKKAKTNGIVALKAVAHKLCRACYYIIKDQIAFNVTKAFA